jgi:hypothetical protein
VTAPLTNNGEAMALPVPPGLTLLPHQQEGIGFAINRLRTNRGAMFGDVMGLGKTIEAIVTANAMGPHASWWCAQRAFCLHGGVKYGNGRRSDNRCF